MAVRGSVLISIFSSYQQTLLALDGCSINFLVFVWLERHSHMLRTRPTDTGDVMLGFFFAGRFPGLSIIYAGGKEKQHTFNG